MTITNLKINTQADLDNLMSEVKAESPNLFQFISDFINKKVSIEEVEAFLKMEHEIQQLYIKNYKART
ncbi:Uncharacterized protein STO1_000640 [Streptococcus oralis subsp. tigurinus]|jgi:hypothetical protein|uniref:Uncharacterized protein n=1 Tax=Streptococcus oralis subsp. tigurinus TaxID=1077464 RepID=A0A223ZRQ3_STROR|nr:hypothetical protein [Streptococcus oralis]BBA07668.1 Uncharacterized protein STO1_000640 [Streptococcus oralis subsp. tigurinus]DAN66297.1 MAG TPA: hypothetical protein [Caudoviricetes sp.]